MKEKIIEVSIDKLKKNFKNPRANVNDLEELEGSMEELGQINPIIIDSNYYILSGHRRLAVAKKLKWKTLKCVMKKDIFEFEKSAILVASNSTQKQFSAWENMEAINDFYWNEFCEFYTFKDAKDRGYTEFAKYMGVSNVTIRSIIKSFEGKNKRLAKKLKEAGVEAEMARDILRTKESTREELVNAVISERKKIKGKMPNRNYMRQFVASKKKEIIIKSDDNIHPSVMQSITLKISNVNQFLNEELYKKMTEEQRLRLCKALYPFVEYRQLISKPCKWSALE